MFVGFIAKHWLYSKHFAIKLQTVAIYVVVNKLISLHRSPRTLVG